MKKISQETKIRTICGGRKCEETLLWNSNILLDEANFGSRLKNCASNYIYKDKRKTSLFLYS